CFQHTRQRTIGAEQVILPNDLTEVLRSELVGKRARRVLIEACGREEIGSTALRSWCHPPKTTEICWPPRMMVMRHSRLGCLVTRSRSRVCTIFSLLTERIRSPRWKPKL